MPNWNEVLKQIQDFQEQHRDDPKVARTAIDVVRRRYLEELFAHTQRNVIAYYSGFLSKPGIVGLEINDEDKNGFMMAVHRLDRSKGLDLILHTPGGSIAATQSIVNYLHKMFGRDIRSIIPQIAMSAGTMVACSTKEIVMGTHSNIGPIDPHLRDVPAYGVILEFKRAFKEVKDDPTRIPIWQTIIGQYRPTFLSQCEDAIKWSNSFVREQLRNVMFYRSRNKAYKAAKVVRKLTDYRVGRQSHERHLHYEDCLSAGLKVVPIESDDTLQDLVLTVHHCYMHSLMNTASYKLIENHLGVAFVKQLREVSVSIPQLLPVQPQTVQPVQPTPS
ncbi:MAG: S49 family peptidase [Dehalococcoidia bacterium]|nr:S49 family peptidase [Dehalococcoidia bacterium]